MYWGLWTGFSCKPAKKMNENDQILGDSACQVDRDLQSAFGMETDQNLKFQKGYKHRQKQLDHFIYFPFINRYLTLLYSILLYSTLLCSVLLHSTLLCFSLLFATLLHSSPLFSTLLCSTLFYSSTLPYSTLITLAFSTLLSVTRKFLI